MQLNITGHNMELTPALRAFTEKKFQRLKAHQDTITSTHITFNSDKLNQIAEAQIHVPGHTIIAKAESDNIYASIDLLMDKLLRQLNKYKEKQTDHR